MRQLVKFTKTTTVLKRVIDYLCFIGGRHIRGRGLGSLLGGTGRSLIPLLKSGGKALLKGARTGMQVAQDVLSGQNVKSALTQAGRKTAVSPSCWSSDRKDSTLWSASQKAYKIYGLPQDHSDCLLVGCLLNVPVTG